jgi:hypothetical protein
MLPALAVARPRVAVLLAVRPLALRLADPAAQFAFVPMAAPAVPVVPAAIVRVPLAALAVRADPAALRVPAARVRLPRSIPMI